MLQDKENGEKKGGKKAKETKRRGVKKRGKEGWIEGRKTERQT